MSSDEWIIRPSEPVLITGPNGFIGVRVVRALLDAGFRNLRCLVRPSSNLAALSNTISSCPSATVEIMKGSLLSSQDCERAAGGARVVFHLAAAVREQSFERSHVQNVVTTETLLRGVIAAGSVRRFVLVSSIVVYTNAHLEPGALMDEDCRREFQLIDRGDAYCSAKVKQEELVTACGKTNGLPYVILRPGVVYGPGIREIHRRVGRRIGTGRFGLFLHLGGANQIPLSYVDNCADAIVTAGLRKGTDGQAFNVVDDDLPTSRDFLKRYKRQSGRFVSIDVPYGMVSAFCSLAEGFSKLSGRPLSLYNRRRCSATWKGNRFTNAKLKTVAGWTPKVGFEEAFRRYCSCQQVGQTDGRKSLT